MDQSLMSQFVRAIVEWVCQFKVFMTGVLASIIGYFLPIKDIIHFIIALFMADVIFGYWAARKLRQERFSVKIIWSHTFPRMLLSFVLVMGAYTWDTTYSVDVVSTYKIIGWFISGVLLFSIAQNGYRITGWKVFPLIARILADKFKGKGLDIDDENGENDGQRNN